MSDNQVKLKGGLAKDAEVVGNDPQNPIIKMRVVTSEQWRDKQTQEMKQSSIGHDVSVFGWRARQLLENLELFKKGALVRVVGKLSYSKDRNSDKWFTNIEVTESIGFEVEVITRFKPKVQQHQGQQGYQNHQGQQGYQAPQSQQGYQPPQGQQSQWGNNNQGPAYNQPQQAIRR